MRTWGGRSEFDYEGSVLAGTVLRYGRGSTSKVDAEQYRAMLAHFRGQLVAVRATRDDPRPGSLEHWLRENVTSTTISSYVAPILVEEGFAVREGNQLRFNR